MKIAVFCLVFSVLIGLVACNPKDNQTPGPAASSGPAGGTAGSGQPVDDQKHKLGLVPGACTDGWSNCTNNNTCTGGTCTVVLASNTSSSSIATATISGTTPTPGEQQYVCAKQGTQIVWTSPAAKTVNQQFVGDFGGLSPWTAASRTFIAGNTSYSDTETVGASPGSCFKYDLFVCDVVCKSAACSCGSVDPKVIIGDDGMMQKLPKH